MEGKIVIELARTAPLPDTGSGIPDLGFTVHQLMKLLPALEYKDISGKHRPLGDHFHIKRVAIEGVS